MDNKLKIWELPDEKTILEATKEITKYIRFLHPDIVKKIVDNNNENLNKWKKGLKSKGVDADIYLWEDCAVCFPGVRRYKGSERSTSFRQKDIDTSSLNAIYIDDNDYPKHLWSYLFTNKPFRKQGPIGYTLAHLIDHNDFTINRRNHELEIESTLPFYGLFTSITNTVYLPNNLYKPTDFNKKVRLMIMNRAAYLYKDICALLPNGFTIPEIDVNDPWHIDNFEWADLYEGNLVNVDNFVKYRNEKMDEFLDR